MRKKSQGNSGVDEPRVARRRQPRARTPEVKGATADLLTFADYARHAGLTERRLRQLRNEGMPTLPAGLVDVAKADAWRKLHCRDYTKQKPTSATTLSASSPVMAAVVRVLGENGHTPGEAIGLDKIRLADEALDVARKFLDVERRRGNSLDRKAALDTVFAWTKARRERLERWPAEITADMAATLGCDPGALRRELDERVRLLLEHESIETFRLAGVEPDDDDDDEPVDGPA